MYDTLEDTDITDEGAPDETGQKRLWVGAVIVAGLAILVSAAVLSVKAPRGPVVDIEAVRAEQAAYRAALTESAPALRRARLTDFLNTYQNSSRREAAAAQLGVLSAAEAEDWAALTHIIFDVEKTNAEKLFALDRYSEVWSGDMLGGRGEDIARMRENLSRTLDELPDRDLPIDPDDIPDADNMAGGSGALPGRDQTPGVLQPQSPFPETEDIIVAPKVRRNAKPRYPRRALNAEAEALIVLRLFIDERGRIQETELVMSEADRYENDFIRAAERAARRTRYEPMTVNGVPIAPADGIIKRFKFEIAD